MRKGNRHKYFSYEAKKFCTKEKNYFRTVDQTQKIHYSEEKASYKIVVLTNPLAVVVH
jgi:hypothetical protein